MVRLVDELRRERNTSNNGTLYSVSQVLFAYNSNRIEGLQLSQDQTNQIWQTGAVTTQNQTPLPVDDIAETTNHFRAFDWVLDHADDELTDSMICHIQGLIKCNTSLAHNSPDQVGHYKTVNNFIWRGEVFEPVATAPVSRVHQLMDRYVHMVATLADNPVQIAGSHWLFERIHPFVDGNGRTGRLLLFKECLHLDTIPPLILNQNRRAYMNGLENFPDQPGYLVDTLLSARDGYQQLMSALIPPSVHVDFSYNDVWNEQDESLQSFRRWNREFHSFPDPLSDQLEKAIFPKKTNRKKPQQKPHQKPDD